MLRYRLRSSVRRFQGLVLLGALFHPWSGQAQPNPDGANGSFISLQRRVVELHEDASSAVVRVKAAFNTNDGESEDQPPRVSLRVGTGFFVSREGHVVTNSSVAGGANRVWVELNDLPFAAEVLGSDAESNFALLRLVNPPKTHGVLPLTPDDPPAIGNFVVAITAPLDLAPTPSLGLASGRDRGFAQRVFPIRFLRVSIPANPGEGGSPVLDLSGRLVGMMIASIPELRSSYVLPARAILRLRDDILFHGGVRPGWAGMDVLERIESGIRTIYIERIAEGSPAEIAGLQTGDQLLQMDGNPVQGIEDIREASFYARIGQVLSFRIRRGNDLLDVPLTISARPLPRAVFEQTERPSPPLPPEPRTRPSGPASR